MKLLLCIISLIGLAACSPGSPGVSGGGGTPNIPVVTPTPPPSPSPSPSPSPTPIVCAPFIGTDWIPDGNPTLTALSASQTGYYVAEFDLTGADPVFTEEQYTSPSSSLTCVRHFNDAVPFGDPYSLTWSDVAGSCGAVSPWLQFDVSVCNSLTVTIRTGSGDIYETQKYKVAL